MDNTRTLLKVNPAILNRIFHQTEIHAEQYVILKTLTTLMFNTAFKYVFHFECSHVCVLGLQKHKLLSLHRDSSLFPKVFTITCLDFRSVTILMTGSSSGMSTYLSI